MASMAALAVISGAVAAAGVQDFYKGRTVSLVIGYSAGGGYDAYARLLARYSASTFPAIRRSCRRNARSRQSARPPTTSMRWRRRTARCSALSRAAWASRRCSARPQYDGRNSPGSAASPTTTPSASPRARPGSRPGTTSSTSLTFGGEGSGADPDDVRRCCSRMCSAPRSKLVSGYPGTNDVALALERGEIDGLCGMSWST